MQAIQIESSWKNALSAEFDKAYFLNLIAFLKKEKKAGKEIFPPGPLIFNAFGLTPFAEVKVVILGQDPYHDNGQAHGLCFSVPDGIAVPPSLQNIFKEIQADLHIAIPPSGNLERWARQGVLLLNATLTVEAHQAGSHQKKGWELFTDAVIHEISERHRGVVFLLWGNYAKQKLSLIDTTKHKVCMSGHPSPLSANRGLWFGNRHFSITNQYLKSINKTAIQW
jgi:uracil-DNA glycosylase